MDTAATFVSRVAGHGLRLGARHVLTVLALVALAMATVVALGLAAPDPEPVVMAPFRW